MDINKVGRALYGRQWRGPLAEALNVNERTVRRWANGEFEINQHVWSDIMIILNDRESSLAKAKAFVDQKSRQSEEARRA